jgi:two-component system, cell cycle response regulator
MSRGMGNSSIASRVLRSPRDVVAAVAAFGLAAFATHALIRFGGDGTTRFFDHWVYNALLVASVVGCLLRTLLVRRDRLAWGVLTVGVAVWAAGDIYWSVALAGLDEPPFPSLADAGYLFFYPAAYVALVQLVRRRIGTITQAVWIDGITAALAMATLSAAVVVDAVLKTTEGSLAAVVTNLAYPIGDMLLLALVVGVFALCGWRPGRSWLLIGASLGAMAIADSIYLFQAANGTYVEGTIVDVLWPGSTLLLAAAAWYGGRREFLQLQHRPLLLVPAAAAAIAISIQVWDHFHRENPLALALSVLTVLAVVVRTGISFRENSRLLESTTRESITDAVTDLGNRRRLVLDLETALGVATADQPWLLVIFDLDGFKGYNDRFGHLSGDALLRRLGLKLGATVEPPGGAYRLGGDEFCILKPADPATADEAVEQAAAALTEHGDGFSIGNSFGAVFIPTEADRESDALRLADQRLYAVKYRKHSERDRPHEVLLQALLEREPNLHEHLQQVASLSIAVGRAIGLGKAELQDLHRAAQLHDIGKIAIPDEVLHRPGPLDEHDMTFIRRHTLVGQRILGASPALGRVGEIVRSTHERWDGAGYPDGLAGDAIPLAARIITACDAYDAMTSDRPYRPARTPVEAVLELRREAGTQFDPEVVRLVCEALRKGDATPRVDRADTEAA